MFRMDIASITGILIGAFAIIAAQMLESNSISTIIQPSAALVVLGGTLGAVLLNFSLPTIIVAFSAAKRVFFEEKEDTIEVIENIIGLANLARQGGVLSLQEVGHTLNNAFLRRGIQLLVDISSPQLLQDILTTEINLDEEQELTNAKVFEAIGGFTPTFGIVGAVLGLIQVMSKLEDPSQLGHGIATAFVATLYGVGIANLVFLPIAGKIKMRLRENILLKEMIIQGLMSIKNNENPAIIQEKLLTFLNYAQKQNRFQIEYKEDEELS